MVPPVGDVTSMKTVTPQSGLGSSSGSGSGVKAAGSKRLFCRSCAVLSSTGLVTRHSATKAMATIPSRLIQKLGLR